MKLNDDLLKSVFDAYKTRSNIGDFVATSLLLLADEKSQENIRQTLENDFFKEKFITSLNTSGNISITCNTFSGFIGMFFLFLLAEYWYYDCPF